MCNNSEQHNVEITICSILEQIKNCCLNKDEIENIKLQIDSVQTWMNDFQEGIPSTENILLSSTIDDIQKGTTLQEVLEIINSKFSVLETNLSIGNRNNNTLDILSSNGNSTTIPAVTELLSGLMSSFDKVKLNSINNGAEQNVQSDWNEVNVNSDAFIKNKPEITIGALSKVDDVNVTLNLSGNSNTALLKNVTLTLGWTGLLADNRIASANIWNSKQDAITVKNVTAASNKITLGGTPTGASLQPFSIDINESNLSLNSIGGTLSINKGGTGLSSLGISNQLLKVNSDGTSLEYFTPNYISNNQLITLSGEVTGSGSTSISVTLNNNAVLNKVLTGFTSSTGTVLPTDTILQAIQKLDGNLASATAGGVSSVTGTLNRITSTGGSNPIIDISSSYVGQSSITTLGTITTGVWNASLITDNYITSSSNWNSKQSGIQFQDEGTNLDGIGTVNTINFTGNYVTVTRINNTLTIDVTGGGGNGTTNLSYTPSSTDGIVVSDTGTDATILAASNTIAGLMIPSDFNKLSNISITQPVNLDAIELDVNDLTTLSGVPSNSLTLGEFTGTLISDNSTIKSALQSLETSLEASFSRNKIRVVSVNTTLSAINDGTVVFDTSGTVATLPLSLNETKLIVKNVSNGSIIVTGHIDGIASRSYNLQSKESMIFHGNGITWYYI